LIRPQLGPLRRAAGIVAHRHGAIRVDLNADLREATIELPPGLSARLQWQGREYELKSSVQALRC
jgi:hypothetical protein